MVIRRRYVTVSETPEGWIATEEGRKPKTGEALKAIKKRDKDLAKATETSYVTTITWEPTTPIGRSVVKILSEN